MKLKPYLSIEDQIAKLESQGLSIENRRYASAILLTHSYFSLVNGYGDLLLKQRHPRVFLDGASFKELLAIFDFDTKLRAQLIPDILYLEDKLKTTCVHAFLEEKDSNGNFIHFGDAYLKVKNYDVTKAKYAKELIANFNAVTRNAIKNKNKAFLHYKKENGYIPLWVLSTALSFGQMSKFYEYLNKTTRDKVASKFNLSEKQLGTVLKFMNVIRNVCAHNSRLYCVYVPNTLPKTICLGRKAMIIDNFSRQKFGGTLYCLKASLSAKRFKRIANYIGTGLRSLSKNLHSIDVKMVLREMGISAGMLTYFGIKIK